MKHSIHLLSCRSREMRTDLLPVYKECVNDSNNIVTSFIRDSEKNDQYDAIHPDWFGHPLSGNSICNDLAMRKFMPALLPNRKQVLLITTNNYYFQLAMRTEALEKAEQKEKLQKFSHIFAPNQLIADLLKKNFVLRSNQKVSILQNPFIWNLNRQHIANDYHQTFLRQFPQAYGKKVLFIMLTNDISDKARAAMKNFSLDYLINQLGSDWVIVTNSLPVLEQTQGISQELASQVIYIKRQYPLEDVLYFSDFLITNLSFFAAAQAGRDKAFYCIRHNGNAFEKYIEKNHPAMYLTSPDDLVHLDYNIAALSPSHRKFYEIFTTMTAENPAEYLARLL